MTQENQNKMEKIVISQEEFDKKVDIAFAYLTYWDRMKDGEARQTAIKEVHEKYVIQRAK